MDDVFRLDLEGYDNSYIRDVFDGFLDGAGARRRKVLEIRMRQVLFDRMGFEPDAGVFKDVPVRVTDTGFDDTIEIVLGPIH